MLCSESRGMRKTCGRHFIGLLGDSVVDSGSRGTSQLPKMSELLFSSHLAAMPVLRTSVLHLCGFHLMRILFRRGLLNKTKQNKQLPRNVDAMDVSFRSKMAGGALLGIQSQGCPALQGKHTSRNCAQGVLPRTASETKMDKRDEGEAPRFLKRNRSSAPVARVRRKQKTVNTCLRLAEQSRNPVHGMLPRTTGESQRLRAQQSKCPFSQRRSLLWDRIRHPQPHLQTFIK